MTMKVIIILLIPVLLVCFLVNGSKPCIPMKFNHSSIVCVCNSTYCDELKPIKPKPRGSIILYTSSMGGLRFKQTHLFWNKSTEFSPLLQGDLYQLVAYFTTQQRVNVGDTILKIIRKKKYQTVFGFGASFTDSAGINYYRLSENTKLNLLSSLYGEKGLEYNLGRVPIGGSDCSIRPYTYNDFPEHDLNLSNFSLAIEDFKYKIPMIKSAQKLAGKDFFLMASCWSPPVWMKTSKSLGGPSRLLKKYYQLYADYHIKFLDEYNKQNLSFWAVTTGNEPSNGIFMLIAWNSLGWMIRDLGTWIANNLGPSIKRSDHFQTKIFAIDDQRFVAPWAVEMLADNKKAFKYIDGIATHWYVDNIFPVYLINMVHQSFPEKMIFSTEASIGTFAWIKEKVQLGSWDRAEQYIKNIFEDFSSWYSAWIDWNIALNDQGGPNYLKNFIDASIIIPRDKDEFYKQPMLYAIGHFSKFIPRNSVRIHVEKITGEIDALAFVRPDGGTAVVMANYLNHSRTITILEQGIGSIKITIPKKSFHTLVYW